MLIRGGTTAPKTAAGLATEIGNSGSQTAGIRAIEHANAFTARRCESTNTCQPGRSFVSVESTAAGICGRTVAMTVLTERWEVIPHGDLGGVSLAPLAGLRPRYGGITMILGTRVRF